jgi:outer membrane protein TolC
MQLASRSLTSLVESDSILGNAAGRLTAPVIGGAGRATVQLRKVQAREAVLAYQGDVLTALRDGGCADRLEADRRRAGQLADADHAARDAADTTLVRFRHGLVTQADVQGAQQTWLSASDSLTQAQGAAAQDVVALYKALGGGWDERRVPDEDKDHGK